jgi:hypothetical protein
MTSTAPDGRHVFTWHDQNVDELANVIASTIEVYAHNDGLVTLKDGKLIPLNLTDFHALVSQHICGVRVVNNGKGWVKEYTTFQFAHTPHPGPRTAAMGLARWEDSREPDAKILAEIYSSKILKLVPKVVS